MTAHVHAYISIVWMYVIECAWPLHAHILALFLVRHHLQYLVISCMQMQRENTGDGEGLGMRLHSTLGM